MRSGVPWSIRGIDNEIREAARAAAHRSGLSVSEWLNDLIAKQTAADRMALSRSRYDVDDDESEIDSVEDIVQRLSGHVRAMDENSRASLSGLQRRFDELEKQLAAAKRSDSDSVAQAASNVDEVEGAGEFPAEMDSVDEAARSTVDGHGERDGAGGGDGGIDQVTEAIRSLEARISAISERIKQPAVDEAPAKLETIKAHLDSLLAQTPEPSSQSDDAVEAMLRSLETHIDEAESRLRGAPPQSPPQSDASPVSPEDDERLRWIEERLSEITGEIAAEQSSRLSEKDFVSAIEDISARQQKVDGLADIAALAREQRQANHSLAALRAEVASLVRKSDYSALAEKADIARVADKADIAALASKADITTLASKIASIGHLGTDKNEVDLRLADRIDELARRIPDSEQIESRLDAIMGRIDSFLGHAAPASAVEELHERFTALAARLDSMNTAHAEPTFMLDEIKSEVAGIRQDIAGRMLPSIDHFEGLIAELARRLDTTAQSQTDGEALSELEAQVAHLASELEGSVPRNSALREVEENLAKLQGYLSESRQESVEAARSAARVVVREISDPPGDSELVRALKDDLEKIRAVAGEADQRSQQTLGSIHGTLAHVVERLTRLEQDSRKRAASSALEPVREADTDDLAKALTPVESGSSIAEHSGASRTQDEKPLPAPEPDTGKLDLAALRELARSAAEGQPDKKGDRRADFIAAARRAAHAAAAEAAENIDDRAGDDEPGAFSRIGLAIRNRKRPLLLAAAALVLALSTIHFFGEPGVKRAENLSDGGEVGSRTSAYHAAPLGSDKGVVHAPAKVSGGPAQKAALVAAPPDVRAAIAFAAPMSVDSRFGPALAEPTAIAVATSFEDDAPERRNGSAILPSRLRNAADIGDPTAAFEIALRYAEGRNVRQDLAKAAGWYQRAAEGGVAVAQFRLGSLLERGEGVERDRAAAVKWYQRAADQGNTGAMHNLAVMVSEGVDGTADHRKAFEWFLSAANHGVADSQYNLGVVFASGLGREQDLVQSYKWFALAAAAGDADARIHRDEIAQTLTADDLTKARSSANAWQQTPAIAEANTVIAPSGGWDHASAGVTDADRRALVRMIQVQLAEQGYDPGPVDGYEGPKTREAVRAFQRNIGLAATGYISGNLASALVSPAT